MGEANRRGTFEQRKQNPKTMQLEDSSKIIADAVNQVIKGGAMPPFVIAILELIKIDLAMQHMAQTAKVQMAMEQAAKNLPIIEGNQGN